MRTFRLIAAALAVCTLALPRLAAAQDGVQMAYRGEIIDDAGAPISGVFPLTFQFYRRADATESRWTEAHFVSVYEGVYDVTLGADAPIPAELIGQEVFVAVEVGTIGEFTRHPITVTPTPAPQTREQVIAELDVTYADVADRALFAVEADRARDCARLGGKTLEELDRYDEVLEELVTVRDRLDDVSGAQLGSRTTTLERIGGAGGNAYSRSCPPGHVVTGARGGSGALIDSIELICSPLQ